MKKFRSNSYEGQLTREELAQVYEVLREPGINLDQATDRVPRWNRGMYAGKKVSRQTLSEICGRMGSNERTEGIQKVAEFTENVTAKIKKNPVFSKDPGGYLDMICNQWGQEVLEKELKEQEKVAKTKVLLKRQDQLLATAKFKRDTCKVFMDWYEDERARRIIESREEAASKLEQLGKLIYGEEW